ncbi:MAG: SDR family NAD(P)-dependent oxidoreductase [Actinomycetota bacterium]
MISLEGKVAVVTGAGRGIGRAHALTLSGLGARIVVNDLGGEWDGSGSDPRPAQAVVAEIEQLGGQASAHHGDVADTAEADALIEQALDTYGRLDILVNNAGILRDRMLVNMTDDDWEAVVRVHLRGHFAPTRAACRYWRTRAKCEGSGVGGRVIHTSSESGLYGNAGQTNYDTAKAGIASFGLAVAREVGRYGVTSNVIAPRARSRMMEMTYGNLTVDGEFDRWDPAQVSSLVAYLCSDPAAHITGQVFVVGGGVLQLVAGFEPAWQLDVRRALDPDAIAAELAAAFEGRSSGPGPIPDLGLASVR